MKFGGLCTRSVRFFSPFLFLQTLRRSCRILIEPLCCVVEKCLKYPGGGGLLRIAFRVLITGNPQLCRTKVLKIHGNVPVFCCINVNFISHPSLAIIPLAQSLHFKVTGVEPCKHLSS